MTASVQDAMAPDEPAIPEAGPRPTSKQLRGERVAADGARHDCLWQIPEEEAVALVYNRRTFAVMLASPADLGDFAIGFSLSEGIVERAADIADLAVERRDGGLAVTMTIPSARAAALVGRRRALEGRSGCGLCGIEALEAVSAPLPAVSAPQVAPAAIIAALADLDHHQPGRRLNRSVHGAAWADLDGNILMAREDVGRHSALDKLIGAMARAAIDPAGGFVLLSSRCSLELVQKSARLGIGLLASVSAPTSLAIQTARAAGMTVAAAGERGEVVFF